MDDEIIKADKNLRKRTFYVIIGIAIGGFLATYYFESLFKEIAILTKTSPEDALEKVLSVFHLVKWLTTITAVSIGVYTFNLSLRIFKFQCLPPPGMRVIKDTKRITGQKARNRAIIGAIIDTIELFLNKNFYNNNYYIWNYISLFSL